MRGLVKPPQTTWHDTQSTPSRLPSTRLLVPGASQLKPSNSTYEGNPQFSDGTYQSNLNLPTWNSTA